eukprot:UN01258
MYYFFKARLLLKCHYRGRVGWGGVCLAPFTVKTRRSEPQKPCALKKFWMIFEKINRWYRYLFQNLHFSKRSATHCFTSF